MKVGTPPVGRKDQKGVSYSYSTIDFSTTVMPFKTESDSVLLACASFEPSNDGKRISFAHAYSNQLDKKKVAVFSPSMHGLQASRFYIWMQFYP